MVYPDIVVTSPPDELEASPAGSRSDDYSLAFLWFSAPPPPKLQTILVCCCCSSWPGLPEPPSLRSKTKQRSQCFRALPACENSPPFTGGRADVRIYASHTARPFISLCLCPNFMYTYLLCDCFLFTNLRLKLY